MLITARKMCLWKNTKQKLPATESSVSLRVGKKKKCISTWSIYVLFLQISPFIRRNKSNPYIKQANRNENTYSMKEKKNEKKRTEIRVQSRADAVASRVPPRLGTQVLARSFQWLKMITMLMLIAQTNPPVKPPISHPLRALGDTSMPPSERTCP